MDAFLIRATLAAVGVAVAAAPLGCFVVWRRMAYFGDATAHAAILGVALSLATSLPVMAGVLLAAILMAAVVAALADRGIAEDTLLGVLAHGSLAIGLVTVSLIPGARVDLNAYLLGDILAVSFNDIIIIWVGAVGVLGVLAINWSALLMVTLDRNMAEASGIRAAYMNGALTLALAVVVAVAIKIVGVLLIAALLIIPAAAARPLVSSPEGMAGTAAAFGVLSAVAGIAMSWEFDTPTGPSIVTAAVILFVATTLFDIVKGQIQPR